MYNFRYHLITIVSIFAALMIGLLLGVALTGSDLVRDASSNLAQSLTEEFDELNKKNESLSESLRVETLFSDELFSNWQANRLSGRTVVILERNGDASAALVSALSALITKSGGIPVVVSIDAKNGLHLENEQRNVQLKKLVPQLENEEYATTVAKALVKEWSFVANGYVANMNSVFEENYVLTNYLVKAGAISITADYTQVTDGIKQLNTAQDSLAALQLVAYTQAQRSLVPYGANGVIDAAFYIPSGSNKVTADSDALRIAAAFESKGRNGTLPYLRLTPNISLGGGAEAGGLTTDGAAADGSSATLPNNFAQSSSVTVAEDVNYFSVLVAADESADVVLAATGDTGISCVLSPFNSKGHYNIIALLTGAKKGSYGLNRNGVELFAKAPVDKVGNLAFKKG